MSTSYSSSTYSVKADENRKPKISEARAYIPPMKIKSKDKPLTIYWSEKFESYGLAAKLSSVDSNLLIGSYLDMK